MSHQITVLRPDESFVEAFFVSDSLIEELTRILNIFELNCFNLTFLQEIEQRALSFCSCLIESQEPTKVKTFATFALDWFDELLALINAIAELHNPYSLSLRLD